jgi:periplasmic divalent cation tolerance protein
LINSHGVDAIMGDFQYGIVFVNVGSRCEGIAIASSLMENHLAAGINISPIDSIYRWQGEIQHHEEWQLVIKTDLSLFQLLEAKVRELHSYQVPEIIAIPVVQGHQPYLQWISAQVRS